MKEKVEYLDGLRGLAAFIVVIDHFLYAFDPALISGSLTQVHTKNGLELIIAKSPLNILYDGNLSVCIFFVLSGYVLTYKFFSTKKDDFIIASASKRYIRLMIPVLAIMFAAFVMMKLSLFTNVETAKKTLSNNWLATFYAFSPNFIVMLKQATYHVFIDNQYNYNSSLWTMTFEFFGSYLVFGLAAIFGKLEKRYIFYIAAALIFRNSYYLAFVLGLIISDAFNSNYKMVEKLKNKYLEILYLIIGLFLGSYPLVDPKNTIYSFMKIPNLDNIAFYHTLGAVFIMLALLNIRKLQRLFSTKILKFLGKISFSMYLIHILVICSFSGFIFMNMTKYMRYSAALSITFIVSLTLIIAISYLFYRYIDNTAIKLSKYVFEKFLLKDFTNDLKNKRLEGIREELTV